MDDIYEIFLDQDLIFTKNTHFILALSLLLTAETPALLNKLVDFLQEFTILVAKIYSRVSNIEFDNSQNVGLEDYNNISVGIFPHFTTPSIKITLG